MVLRMALRMGEHLGPSARARRRPSRRAAAVAHDVGAATRVLAAARRRPGAGESEACARKPACRPASIDGLVDEGHAGDAGAAARAGGAGRPTPISPRPDFPPPQRAAADALRATRARPAAIRRTLLDGVTGSGKTEVYFEAVAEASGAGRQALILMPEIALTDAVPRPLRRALRRRARRSGIRELSPRQRARTWPAVATGEVSVVVGARSALFLPYADLGLIIVDEEHDPAYKQEDGVRYHARDMAVVRARSAEDPDRAGLGDAVGRNRGQRPARPLRARCICRNGSAASICRRIEAIDLRTRRRRRADASSRRGSPRR